MIPDPTIKLIYIDLFCGAGGTSTGVEKAKYRDTKCAKVVLCVNHDKNAIASHAANHPDALHFNEDIRTVAMEPIAEHIRKMRALYPNALVVLWASLECTNFSKAKGGQSRDADSRTLADHLPRYIHAIDPDFIQIENVEEFMTWGPLIVKVAADKKTGFESCPLTWKKEGKGKNAEPYALPTMIPDPAHKGEYYRRWVQEVKDYLYDFDYRILNSADFGARTSRKRFFGIFAKCGLPIVFPTPTHAKVPTGNRRKWNAVKDVLDLDNEGTSIFDRKKPLSDKTLERITAGVIKFVGGGKETFLVKYNSMSQSGKYQAPGIDDPCPTVSCQNRLGVAKVSFLSKYYSGHPESKNISLEEPAHTIKCKDNHALIQARFLASYYGSGANVCSVGSPAPTVTTKDRFAYVSPKFLLNQYSGGGQHAALTQPGPGLTTVPKQNLVSCTFIDQQFGNSKPVTAEKPLGAITTNPKYNLVSCKPWLMDTNFNNIGASIEEPSRVITANRKHHYLLNPQFNSAGASVDKPCFTLIARMDKRPPFLIVTETGNVEIRIFDTDTPTMVRLKQVMAILGIIDIKMRMLLIPELKQIMGFPRGYILIGTKANQKKYIGNAVETTTACAFCEILVEKIMELKIAA